MFSNATLEDPGITPFSMPVKVRDAHGSNWAEAILKQTLHHERKETTQHRSRRLRLHGTDSLRTATNAPTISSNGYRPVLKAICARNEERAQAFADQWSSRQNDWKALIARDDIDTIDICTPNDTHAPIAIAAMKLADGSLQAARPDDGRSLPMVEAVEKAGVANAV